jgi:lipopolysaccharide transport system ATP-binding protein
MSQSIIEVRGISKSYQLGSIGATSFSDAISRTWNRMLGATEVAQSFEALRDISFDVERGDVLGIVGSNGAGKSTLLKILSRITEPTAGEITLRGRVASLLEVGTGFHPELTGRENVFLNGAILGMKKREIAAKFDEIVDFAGVERFIDTPTKRYSSGMSVRLAFAVAAHLEPEILIVDEVLAVGDAAFQRKCLDKMKSVTSLGRTVLFVSHNLGAVSNLCTRALLIESGRLTLTGTTDQVIQRYLNSGSRKTDCYSASEGHHSQIINAHTRPAGGNFGEAIKCGDSIDIRVDIQLPHKSSNVKLGIGIDDANNNRLLTAHPDCDPDFHLKPSSDRIRLSCRLERPGLVEGTYSLTFLLMVDGKLEQKLEQCMTLEIAPGDFFGNAGKHFTGSFLVDQTWSDETTSLSPRHNVSV